VKRLSIYVAAGFEVIRKGVAFTEREVLRSVLLEELVERRLLIFTGGFRILRNVDGRFYWWSSRSVHDRFRGKTAIDYVAVGFEVVRKEGRFYGGTRGFEVDSRVVSTEEREVLRSKGI
jgi:hypothetical protein